MKNRTTGVSKFRTINRKTIEEDLTGGKLLIKTLSLSIKDKNELQQNLQIFNIATLDVTVVIVVDEIVAHKKKNINSYVKLLRQYERT